MEYNIVGLYAEKNRITAFFFHWDAKCIIKFVKDVMKNRKSKIRNMKSLEIQELYAKLYNINL